ncbi:helix-turn-helix domain-containing protein [Bacillus chungangensis]|uniref:helix-turn-helix domain-containing protein n=1 Tax=Bacillus chungangensis TaxID=587633 RepID=UPI0027D7BBA9|nr:helix-turn-helix transcriptional regulator [Bacillus chungangensis]
MVTNADGGKLLRKVREDSGLTQSDMAEILNYDTSVISKLENDKMFIKIDLYMNWLKKLGRKDILALTIMGVPFETIMKECFTKEYKEKLEQIKSQPPSPEAIEKFNKAKKEYGSLWEEIEKLMK